MKKIVLEELFDNFVRQIEALNEYVLSINEYMEKKYKEDIESDKDTKFAKLLIQFKSYQLNRKELDPKDLEHLEKLEKMMEPDSELTKILEDLKMEGEDKQSSLSFNGNYMVSRKLRKYFNKADIQEKKIVLLYNTSFISLITTYQYLFSDFLRLKAQENVANIGIQDKKISFSDLQYLNSLEEINEHFIENYISDTMIGPIGKWMSEIMKRCKLTLIIYGEYAEELNEAFQRRNIIVHNNSKVNQKYISNVSQMYLENYKMNDVVKIDEKYLLQKIKIIKKIGIHSIYEIWMKHQKHDITRSNVFSSFGLALIKDEEYDLAEEVYTLILEDKYLENELISKINYWQVLKWKGELNLVKEEIIKTDMSTEGPVYEMCKSLLLDDLEDANINFSKALKNKTVNIYDLYDWPIFKDFIDYEPVKILLQSVFNDEQEQVLSAAERN
ncbi:hypothetical protein H7992_07075 [Sporosarcina sp. resist]|uniref:hypothetical protein n=1 Tax=Sporosarcina sp. resist TaxID=2762563 RepID=UPI00164E805A|nr:hypothetical protein [Sporosarcina sp. resist]QNK89421.1 hypothetical protein H7992_07075 [Sporosarcina sp. resist]